MIQCVQITRGMAPAVSVASTVGACARHKIEYKLIAGKPAHEAKNDAARLAYDKGADLLLVEDDILVGDAIWRKVVENDSDVMLATALMKNGELNTWFQGERVVYSGTVFLKVPHAVLARMGDPWFAPRDLYFNGSTGEWCDKGENEHGLHSDTWFYYRCWALGVLPIVAGFAVHLLHPDNWQKCDLVNPHSIRPLGMMDCAKVVN